MSELNVFFNPETPVPVVHEEIADEGHNRRGAFAAMRDLSDRFADAGLHTEQVWDYLKADAGVETRSQLTAVQWASIACRLQALRRNPMLFEVFVDGIPDQHFRFYVLSTDPTVAVGRPRVPLSDYHKPEVWGDFQQLADTLQTELKVTQGKKTVFYASRPKLEETPVETATPELEKSPVKSQESPVSTTEAPNSRGEILNVFGDVVEVVP